MPIHLKLKNDLKSKCKLSQLKTGDLFKFVDATSHKTTIVYMVLEEDWREDLLRKYDKDMLYRDYVYIQYTPLNSKEKSGRIYSYSLNTASTKNVIEVNLTAEIEEC
jgi:hypothetical protein